MKWFSQIYIVSQSLFLRLDDDIATHNTSHDDVALHLSRKYVKNDSLYIGFVHSHIHARRCKNIISKY